MYPDYTSQTMVIAMHQGEDGYVSMKDVAARQQISKKYMEAFTAPLASAGILGIRRGKAGGYRLLVPPDEITLWRIVSLIEGPLHAVACLQRPVNECARCGFCITLPMWTGLNQVMNNYLSKYTLQTLIDQALPQPELEDMPVPD